VPTGEESGGGILCRHAHGLLPCDVIVIVHVTVVLLTAVDLATLPTV